MWFFIFKAVVVALIISFCSWFSNKRPDLSGFIVAMPLMTLIALPFAFVEYRDSAKSVEFAKSIFIGVPVSLLFFMPFLFAQKFNLGFGICYGSGVVLLVFGYFIHQWILSVI